MCVYVCVFVYICIYILSIVMCNATDYRVARRREMIRSHIEVKESDMGFVIGKGGFRIQQISTNTGAQLFTKRSVPNRIFIEAEKEEAIEKAKIEVLRVIVRRFA